VNQGLLVAQPREAYPAWMAGSFIRLNKLSAVVEKFQLKSLAEIDGGRIAIAFEQALKRVIQDCEDRPGDKKERTVNLSLTVKPVLDADGFLDDCDVQLLVSDSVPKRKSKVYKMAVRKGGHLVYNPESLGSVSQQTLDLEE